VGDEINEGDVICSIETDKAQVDFEATDPGFVAKLLVPDGANDVPVGSPILVIVEDESDVAAFANFELEAAPAAAEAPAPAAAPVAAAPAPVAAPVAAAPASTGGRVFASPKARMMARETGMDLSQVTGTGPRGRVTAVDIEEFIAAGVSATAPAAAAAAAPASVAGVGFSDVAVPADKLAYAATMELSKQTIPHYYLTIDMNLEKLLAIRAELNSTLAEDEQISVNDFFIRASALAMKTVPDMNSSWMDTFVRQYHSVNTAVTVGDGVPTPVIANTNALGLFAISSAAKGALEKHSTGALTSADISGATFTISNLGMFGIKTASPVISPNQAGHLAIGNIEKRIIPNDDPDSDEIYKEAYMVTATMSCDHRVVDGAVGATWLQVFKGLVEKPITMLL